MTDQVSQKPRRAPSRHVPLRKRVAKPAGPACGRRHRDKQANFLTIAEVADRLGVATRTVRRWIESDALVVHRVGRVVRIAEGDLQVFLALHRDD
jgi:excisionase family DNA binding protein